MIPARFVVRFRALLLSGAFPIARVIGGGQRATGGARLTARISHLRRLTLRCPPKIIARSSVRAGTRRGSTGITTRTRSRAPGRPSGRDPRMRVRHVGLPPGEPGATPRSRALSPATAFRAQSAALPKQHSTTPARAGHETFRLPEEDQSIRSPGLTATDRSIGLTALAPRIPWTSGAQGDPHR